MHVNQSQVLMCKFFSDNSSVCIGCPMGKSIHGRPNEKDFMKYLPWFLKDNPGLKCAKG